MASTENLAGYTILNQKYTEGAAGAITGIRSALPATFSAAKGRVNKLNGDPTMYFFKDADGNLRAVVAQYIYKNGSATLALIRIYDVTLENWLPVTDWITWPGIKNLHDIVVQGDYLYGIDYDEAKVVKIDMNDGYTQIGTYTFLPTDGYESHGVALASAHGYIYALFTTVKAPWGTADYQLSTVVQLNVDGDDPLKVRQVNAGKNAFTLERHTVNGTNYLYAASIGGKQQYGTHNPDSALTVIALDGSSGAMTPHTALKAGSLTGPAADKFDIRDIAFSDDGTAYVLAGCYNTAGTHLVGNLYKTTAAVINGKTEAPLSDLGTPLATFDTAGYLWALLYENVAAVNADRLWFVKGNQIDIYKPDGSSARSFMPAELGTGDVNVHLNSVTLIGQAPGLTAYRGTRSLAAHARLAAEARQAVLEHKQQDEN
ncbi:hypothetical protein [Anaerospora hongkongensis]|uniref:hypothetical protein n=1 Tax=Anaerospora hongkongensis TaxID=244830 RepID=UPI0028971F66|nr:hypothetical protein [Anaerospora hongkongensis]